LYLSLSHKPPQTALIDATLRCAARRPATQRHSTQRNVLTNPPPTAAAENTNEDNMIDINQLTLGQIKEIQALAASPAQPQSTAYEVGKCYLIRTATYHVVGRLARITDSDLVLENASWVADSGRFHNALRDGKLNEVESFVRPVIVSRGGLIDGTEWIHPLPDAQK
jgi:hypothetical protein